MTLSKAILALISFIMLCGIVMEASADIAITPGYPNQPNYPRGPQEDPRNNPGGRRGNDRRVIQVNRMVTNETIDLLSYGGLDRYRDQGARIESVEVEVMGRSRATIVLVADNSDPVADRPASNRVHLQPYRELILGRTVQTVGVYIDQPAQVSRIIINLERRGGGGGGGYPPTYPPQPQPPTYPQPPHGPGQRDLVVDVNLHRQFRNGERMEIGSMVRLYDYTGYQISAVEIEGSNLGSDYGRVSVLSNNDLVGAAQLTRYNQTHVDSPRTALIIGRNVGYVQIFVDGNAQVNRIRFRLTRF